MSTRLLRYVIIGFSVFLILALLLGTLAQVFAAEIAVAPDAGDRVIVVFRDEVIDEAEKDLVVARMGARKIKDLPIINGTVVNAGAASMSSLTQDPNVLRVEHDGLVTIAAQTTPWGLSRLRADQVWDRDRDGHVDSGANAGDGVKIAVLDTGIHLTHPDLIDNIKGGISFVSGASSPDDDEGHGTHVAGTIAAADNSAGVVGIAPRASLYAVKVLSSTGSGYISDIVSGLQWAIANDMQVVNMSFGGDTDVKSFHDAITAAYNAGIVLVAAAGNTGNDGPGADIVGYPAKYPEVIAVAATDGSNNVASFSSRGPEVELSSPGVSILSTTMGGGYGTASGTSMASPHTAGAAALVIGSGMTDTSGNGRINDEIRARLTATADDLGASGHDPYYGYGLVDANDAVDTSVPPPAPPPAVTPPVVTTGPATSMTGSSATLNGALTSLGSASTVDVSFRWGTTSATTGGETAPSAMSSAGAFSAGLTDLTPGLTYYFKSKAVGDSTSYGTLQNFVYRTTPPSVTTGAATSVTGTTATLNGTLSSLGSASPVNVSFLWGTTSATTGGETAPVAMTSAGAFSADLTGLTPGVAYYVKAKAAGEGTVYGRVTTFRFAALAPRAVTYRATSVDKTSATIGGSLLSLGSAPEVTVSLLWGTTPATTNETAPEIMSATGTFSADLDGLTAGERYYFRTRAVGDRTSLGAIYSFRFNVRAPRVVSYPPASTSVTSNSATLTGNLLSLGSAATATVNFQWGTDPAMINQTAPISMAAPGRFEVTIDGLSPGVRYFFRAKAEGDATAAGPIRSLMFRLRGPRVTSYSASGTAAPVSSSAATLNGSLLDMGSATSVQVSFVWGTTTAVNDGETASQTLTGKAPFSIEAPGLSPATRYYYRAKAVGDGTSMGELRAFVTGT